MDTNHVTTDVHPIRKRESERERGRDQANGRMEGPAQGLEQRPVRGQCRCAGWRGRVDLEQRGGRQYRPRQHLSKRPPNAPSH
eukprot:1526464-Rhodomonas_salina.1